MTLNVHLRKYYRRHTRHLAPWSAFDERELRRLARKKWSARLIAKRLNRAPGAVRYKAMKLGVKFRSINRTR